MYFTKVTIRDGLEKFEKLILHQDSLKSTGTAG